VAPPAPARPGGVEGQHALDHVLSVNGFKCPCVVDKWAAPITHCTFAHPQIGGHPILPSVAKIGSDLFAPNPATAAVSTTLAAS